MSEDVRIKCKYCGHLNLSQARFCAQCGKKLDDQLISGLQKRYISTNDAKEIYESGKELYKLDQYSESAKAFEKAVRLETNNTEFKEWLGKALLKLEKYQEAIKVASNALEINPNLSIALWVRARAKAELKDLRSSFADVSKSIELNPSDFEAILARRRIYYLNRDWENWVGDAIRINELRGDIKYYSNLFTDSNANRLLDTINIHLKTVIYPILKANGERFVEYWPAIIEWGRETRQHIHETHTSYKAYSTIGGGYLCLTDQNVRIVSLGQMNNFLEAHVKKGVSSFVADVLTGVAGGVVEHPEISKDDKLWTIPNQTIVGAQISESGLTIATAVMRWSVNDFGFGGESELMSVALNMAMTGKLARIGSATKGNLESKSSEEAIKLLKQLGELLERGIITQEEFDQKKKELLAKL